MSLSPSRGRDEQVNLINRRSLSSKNLSSQDSEYTVVRCCQMFAGVSTLVVLAFLLLKGSNELAKNFYEAPDRKAQNFLPPPPIERQGKKEAHGWVVVDDDSDDENEKKHYDNGYRWKWEGSTRYAAIQDAQPCYYEPVRDSKPGQDCFCQLAGNKACRSMPCQCPQGCSSDLTWRHHNTTTFKNFKYATGCQSQSSVALLTVPESHFENIRYLKTWCPKGAQSLLVEMFQKSLETFRDVVDKGPVRQCIHAAESVSVPWFHLHTICADGRIDGLPSSANIGWGSNMHSSSDAEPLAASVMVWAERLYGISGDTMPSSCSQMGCGIRGAAGRCSCHADCNGESQCCNDFSRICPT